MAGQKRRDLMMSPLFAAQRWLPEYYNGNTQERFLLTLSPLSSLSKASSVFWKEQRHNVALTRAASLRKNKFLAAVAVCHFWGNRNVPDSDLIFQKLRASLPLGDKVVTFGFISAPVLFGSRHEVAGRGSPGDVNFPSYGSGMVYISTSEHLRKLSTSSEPLSGTLRKDPGPHGQMLKGQIYCARPRSTCASENRRTEEKKTYLAHLHIHVQALNIQHSERNN